MRLIDTHAHLDFPYLHDQLDDILAAARSQGVERVVAIGASRGIDSNWRAQAIAAAHDNIRCTAGIHPQ
ncbi:MAG: TatD family hydrolase, partial [Myxococcota bacterium]